MTGKPAPELEPLDLVVRARRGALSAPEREALEQALATSATVRAAYEAGSALDRVTRVRAGDEALLERAIQGALAQNLPMRRRRLPRVAALFAATLALASAAAATRQVLVWRSHARLAEAPSVARVEPAAPNRTAAPRAPSPAARSAEPPLPEVTAPTPPRSTARPDTPLSPSRADTVIVAEPAPPLTAASLFRDAGAARREGDLARARSLYAELERSFPTSDEARVSRVSLGKLYLSAGNAREAEASFAQYLRSGATALREEALVGRADALMTLGRSSEELTARNELVRRYPASVYANRARERIAEIEGNDRARPR
jgi:TolA-binding protein